MNGKGISFKNNIIIFFVYRFVRFCINYLKTIFNKLSARISLFQSIGNNRIRQCSFWRNIQEFHIPVHFISIDIIYVSSYLNNFILQKSKLFRLVYLFI
ncbi:cell surface protein [Listeria monocytogenes]|nr:cell surface protein [Listeria monocytogenes]